MRARSRRAPRLTTAAQRLAVCLALSAAPLGFRSRAEEPPPSSPQAQVTASVAPDPGTTGSANELAPTYAELLAISRGLASERADARETALTTLTELGGEALPAIRERLHKIAAILGPNDLSPPLQALRKAADAGGARLDLASGILRALESDRSEHMLLACELVSLLRALEAQESLAATQVLVSDLLTIEPRLLRPEAVRERRRLGKLLVPAYLRHRRDPRPAVQKLARESLMALAHNGDEKLFSQVDGDLQAAVITSLGDSYQLHEKSPAVTRSSAAARLDAARERSSVPWVVAHLDDARPAVRDAARHTTQVYGAAADEAVRQRSTDLVGAPPESTWSTARVLDQLLQHMDAERTERTSTALQAALRALEKGDLGDAEQQLALALAEDPNDAQRRQSANAYQELSKRLDEADLPTRALVAARRAVRLGGPETKPARARTLYLEAERRLGGGVADLHALRTAGTLDPTHPDALPLLEELRGGRIANDLELRRQLGFFAAGLFAVAACLVLYFRRASLRRARTEARKEGSATRTQPSIY